MDLQPFVTTPAITWYFQHWAQIKTKLRSEDRVGDFLDLDPINTSVVCTTSGTVALRAVLKGVRIACGSDGRNEVIVPQTTVGATIEAVIDEGFCAVFVPVDPASWLLSPEATQHAITAKTAAIITVDWLGTQCDLEPFRKLSDEHDIKLISDSAQSFGASIGKPPAVLYTDATIYSLGYPKVLTGAGSGGLIVCSALLERLIQSDPSGILRHEAMTEVNAYMALQALGSLPEALKARRAAGELYRRRLATLPGITFQQVPAGMETNHYQVSFTIDAKVFGLNAKGLCETLRSENVHCSAARMPCVAANERFASLGRVEGGIEHSSMLAATSVTLPISNIISLVTVATICDLIELIYKKASEIVEAQGKPASVPTVPSKLADVIDIESKFRQHLFIPVLDDASAHSSVIVPRDYLHEHHTSIDEFINCFTSRLQWIRGESVLGELRVYAIIGTMVIVAPHNASPPSTGSPVALDESGSPASVDLLLGADGELTVRKSAVGYGIDGNGAPWLRRQALFLGASHAVAKTDMFVQPTEVKDHEGCVTLWLPYVASHSFGELAFANVGPKPLVGAMVSMLARMATNVWTEGQVEASSGFIRKAHCDRAREKRHA